jgi:hypothetical protein
VVVVAMARGQGMLELVGFGFYGGQPELLRRLLHSIPFKNLQNVDKKISKETQKEMRQDIWIFWCGMGFKYFQELLEDFAAPIRVEFGVVQSARFLQVYLSEHDSVCRAT